MSYTRKTIHIPILVLILLLGQFFAGATQTRAQSSQVWTKPVNISNSGSTLDPAIVVGRDGVIHAIWGVAAGGFRYSRSEDGVTWSTPRVSTFPFVEKEGFPYRFIASPDGAINILWINLDGNLMMGRSTSEQLPVPTSWPSIERIGDSVLSYDIDVTSDGVFHLTYIRTDEKAGVYYRRSPNGAFWSQPLNLYNSQYISSIKFDDAHLRVSVSENSQVPTVFVTWDVRSIKRIFMATSQDSGLTFSETVQVKGPEDTGGYGTPFNIEVGVYGKDALMVWQVGEPGATQCTFYSQSSTDGGLTWTQPIIMLDARSLCPEQMKFLIPQPDFYLMMLNYKGGVPALVAWNGVEWSDPQEQNELTTFINPVTFDTLLFRCENEAIVGSTLYLVGCDEGTGLDTWITSRSLEPLSQWTGSLPVWSFPEVLALESRSIANVVQIPEKDRIHAIWFDSPFSSSGEGSHSIYYARLDGTRWGVPQAMIRGLIGKPTEISAAVSPQGSLYVVWADEHNDALVYTRVGSDRAELSSEWAVPQGIPTLSRLNSAPDILVDASGKLLVAYSIPFNEGRGIYLIELKARELTWSSPVQVFDAAEAEWEMVDNPHISLTGDGKLHLLFSRFTRRGEHASGLYYSQSSDGGASWAAPELIREGSIPWSEIVSYDNSTLHRIWQEDQKMVVSNFDQVSRDAGVTWSNPVEITGVLDHVTPVSLAVNGVGDMHFLRIVEEESPSFVKEYDLVVEDWKWDGTGWMNQEFQTINIKGDRATYFLSGGFTANGLLSALVSAEYLDLDGQLQGQITNISRESAVMKPGVEPFSALIATPPNSVQTQPAELGTPQPTENSLDSVNKDSSTPPVNRNLAGILLVSFVLVLALFYVWRRAGKKS